MAIRPPGSSGDVGLPRVITRGSGGCNPGIGKAIRPPGSDAGSGLPVSVGRLKVPGIAALLGYLSDEETGETVTEDNGESIVMQ